MGECPIYLLSSIILYSYGALVSKSGGGVLCLVIADYAEREFIVRVKGIRVFYH